MFRVMSKVKILSPADNPGSPKTISMLWIIKSGLLKVCDSDWLSCFSEKKSLIVHLCIPKGSNAYKISVKQKSLFRNSLFNNM